MGDSEEYEHIPWSQLEAATSRPMPSLFVLAVVAAIGIVVGVGVMRVAGGTTAPPEAVALPATTPADPVAVATPTPVTVAPPTLYSEADLMAVLPEEEQRLAAAHAEWFTTDALTVTSDEVQTYVEWARAFRVDASQPDVYEVDVAYRLLIEDPDTATFARAPLAAVRVRMSRTLDGSLAVDDLPTPVEIPVATPTSDWPEAAAISDDVAAEALARLSELGLEGTVVGGHATEDGWRIVVDAAHPGGPSLPMVLRLPA